MWMKKNSKTSYIDFIESIKGTRVSDPCGTEKKKYWIRHDVDYSIEHALDMAAFEYEHDIQSTYFLLPTAKYFDYSSKLIDYIKLFETLGHSIGFHNDILGDCIKNNYNPLITELNNQLDFFSNHTNLKFTSSHGSKEYYDLKLINYQLWKEYNPNFNEGYPIKWSQTSLKGYNLHEAYFLPYTHYFSDSGNNWIGYVVDGVKLFERSALESEKNLGSSVIGEFNKCEEGFLQLLIHPCHWEEM